MDRETLLRAVNYDYPARIPTIFHINLACWDHYARHELAQIVESHPTLFPEGVPPYAQEGVKVPYQPWCRAEEIWEDPWGCRWQTTLSGLMGSVIHHSLKDLKELETFSPPNPDETTHWYPVIWERGKSPTGGSIGFFTALRSGEIGHGHTFLKLIDMVGYEKALFLLYDAPWELTQILEMLQEFNLGLVERFIDYVDVEWMGYAEDLGMQIGPMLSPSLFKNHIAPLYRELMEPAAKQGAVIHMHSDGDIRALGDQLLKLPVRVFNVQDRVNSIEWLKENFKNRVVIDLDIDRQFITQQNDPYKVQEYLNYVMKELSDEAGGLILTYGLYPYTPLAIVKAMADYFEEISLGGRPWTT